MLFKDSLLHSRHRNHCKSHLLHMAVIALKQILLMVSCISVSGTRVLDFWYCRWIEN